MAFPGHRDDRIGGWNGHVCISGRDRLVGGGRDPNRATLHARPRRGVAAAGGLGRENGAAARARHLQRQVIRLAAAGDPLPHDPHDWPAVSSRASGPPASGAESVASAARIGAVGGTGAPGPGLGSWRGCQLRTDSTDVPEFFARSISRATGPRLSTQPDGPPRAGGSVLPRSFDTCRWRPDRP